MERPATAAATRPTITDGTRVGRPGGFCSARGSGVATAGADRAASLFGGSLRASGLGAVSASGIVIASALRFSVRGLTVATRRAAVENGCLAPRAAEPHFTIPLWTTAAWPLLPEIGAGEIDEVVATAADDRLEHVEAEALGHFDCDARRNREHHPAHDGVDEHRPLVCQRLSDTSLDVAGIFEPDPTHAHRLGHGGEIRVLEARAGV